MSNLPSLDKVVSAVLVLRKIICGVQRTILCSFDDLSLFSTSPMLRDTFLFALASKAALSEQSLTVNGIGCLGLLVKRLSLRAMSSASC